MTSLESIVLPLPESRALAEAGIALDTAMVWVYVKDANGRIVLTVMSRRDAAGCIGANCDGQKVICGAPVLSEMLDAIQAKVGGKPTDETTVILSHGSEAGAFAGVRTEGGKYEIATASNDLLAAASLLLEVSR